MKSMKYEVNTVTLGFFRLSALPSVCPSSCHSVVLSSSLSICSSIPSSIDRPTVEHILDRTRESGGNRAYCRFSHDVTKIQTT